MTVKRKRRKQIITRAHIWLWSGQPTAPHFKQHPRDERLAAQVQVSCSQFCRVQSSEFRQTQLLPWIINSIK